MLSSKISTHLIKHSHRSKFFGVFHYFDVTRSSGLYYYFCKALTIKCLIYFYDGKFLDQPKLAANLFKLLSFAEIKFMEIGHQKLILGTGE